MGKLYFKYGAMGCGKTTELLQVVYNYEKNGYKVILLKPEVDKKGDDEVVSRIGASRKVNIILGKDEKVIDKVDLDNVSSIVVDEAQFLSNE